MEERSSNYEKTRDMMEREFAKYDQEAIIRKFALRHDRDHLYVRLAGADYRIGRETGRVEREKAGEWVHAGFEPSMILFDILAWSKPDCRLSGQYVPISEVGCLAHSASPVEDVFADKRKVFTGRAEDLKKACKKLGGIPGTIGDVSAVIPLLDFFPVAVQFWDADEEFDAVLKFMWDKNATDFMHYETIAYATGHLMDRLRECMDEGD